jgi:hypothetical protein
MVAVARGEKRSDARNDGLVNSRSWGSTCGGDSHYTHETCTIGRRGKAQKSGNMTYNVVLREEPINMAGTHQLAKSIMRFKGTFHGLGGERHGIWQRASPS